MINQRFVRKYFQAGCFSAAIILCIIFKLLHSSVIIPDAKGYPYLFNGKQISWLLMCSIFAYWVYNQWQRHNFPRPPQYPGALPLIGHAHQFLGDSVQLWNHLKEIFYYSLKEGGVVTVRFGPTLIYVVTDPDDFFTVANTCFEKPYIYLKFLGNGLVTADAHLWKMHRKLLSPAFNQQMMNIFVQVFNNQARRLVNQLTPEVGMGIFNPKPYLLLNALETSGQTTLNLHSEDHKIGIKYAKAVAGYMDCIPKRFQNIWINLPFVYNFTSLKTKQNECVKQITDICNTVIDNRKSELNQNDTFNNIDCHAKDNSKPLIDRLIRLAAEDNGFSDGDIRDHLNTVLVASYETTVSTLMFTLTLIGTHQAVQDRIYNEIQEVFNDTGELHVDRYALQKLVYLEAVLKESMRLYPAAPAVARSINQAVKLKNVTLEAGTVCFLSIYGVGRHPIWGADAEQFRPERWLEPGGVPDNPNAFTNFSLGKRNCIGKLYAMMSMKTTLAHFLNQYRVTADANNLVLKIDPILRAISGNDIALELRT